MLAPLPISAVCLWPLTASAINRSSRASYGVRPISTGQMTENSNGAVIAAISRRKSSVRVYHNPRE